MLAWFVNKISNIKLGGVAAIRVVLLNPGPASGANSTGVARVSAAAARYEKWLVAAVQRS